MLNVGSGISRKRMGSHPSQILSHQNCGQQNHGQMGTQCLEKACLRKRGDGNIALVGGGGAIAQKAIRTKHQRTDFQLDQSIDRRNTDINAIGFFFKATPVCTTAIPKSTRQTKRFRNCFSRNANLALLLLVSLKKRVGVGCCPHTPN